jgi:hypothetical protein
MTTPKPEVTEVNGHTNFGQYVKARDKERN